MRTKIRFLLGGEQRELGGFDPATTLLDWLRTVERRTGTKEGCNEGDCGACTVLLSRLAGGRLVHEPVCACIRLLATLDGCALTTIEDLDRPGGTLHPVQQAMVEEHGSQCGFCTPGIVMSLFALWLEQLGPVPERMVDDRLAGNLCRCTGYAPIVRAARRMYELGQREADPFLRGEPTLRAQLAALGDAATVAITGPDGRRFLAPVRSADLAELLLTHPEATLLAGGTDVGLEITKALRRPGTLIWLGRVAELRHLEAGAGELRLGAAVTWREAAPQLQALAPGLEEILHRFAGEQIRSCATIAGNLANASPVGDGSPALLALDARLVLRRGGERRELPLAAFFQSYRRTALTPGEFIEAVVIPKPARGTRIAGYKVSKRRDQDIATVTGVFALRTVEGRVVWIRLAYGGMAPVPARAAAAEAALLGAPFEESTIERAIPSLSQDFTPISNHRASAAYRREVAGNLLRRFWLEGQDVPVRLETVEPILG